MLSKRFFDVLTMLESMTQEERLKLARFLWSYYSISIFDDENSYSAKSVPDSVPEN
jgi:hypothetical protein